MDKRYLIIVGAVLVQAVTIGCVFGYGVFFTVLESEFGWSRGLLSIATSLAFFNMGIFAIAAGRLTDRFGPRGVLLFTAMSTGLAYVLMYFLSAPWQLLAIYGLLVSPGLATHDVVTLSTVARWFPRRRGMVSGIVKVGAGAGQMLIPVVTVGLIALFGWREAFAVLGISAVCLLGFAAMLVGFKPGDPVSAKSVENSAADPQINSMIDKQPVAAQGFSMREAKKRPEFRLLCAMQFFQFGTLITIPTHIVPHGIDSGLSPAGAAAVLSAIAASSIAGRLVTGGIVDRIGGKRSINICLFLLFASVVSLLFIVNNTWLYAFGVLYGFAHGGLFTVMSPTVAEYFGMRSHGAIFGVVVFTGTVGGALLPIATGLIFDKLQSYQWAFLLLATMVLISFLLSLRLSPSQLQQTANTTSDVS